MEDFQKTRILIRKSIKKMKLKIKHWEKTRFGDCVRYIEEVCNLQIVPITYYFLLIFKGL